MRLHFTITLAALLAVAVAPLPGRARQGAAARGNPPAAKRTARLHGVGLTYDAALAAEVKVEVASPFGCGKPGDVMPKHAAFTFDGYPRPHPEPFMRPPEVMVFPVAEYRRVLAACDREMAATVIASSAPLNYVSDFDDQVRTLKALNAARPAPRALGAWLRRNRSRRHHRGRMPLVPMYDASEALRAKVSYLDFHGGRGVAFVTQFTVEDTLVSNQALAYVFQGLTDDGRFYVSAAFPVAAPFLPAEYSQAEAGRLGLNQTVMAGPTLRRRYRDYLAATARRLEALAPERYRPGLRPLDELLRSLEIDRRRLETALDLR